jgi:adenylate kinase
MVLFVRRSHQHRPSARTRPRDRGAQQGRWPRPASARSIDLRATDLSEELVRAATRCSRSRPGRRSPSLQELYHYHFVNAEGPIAEVQANILDELKYQSSLELDPRTFEILHVLPLAEELVVGARQELVKRLDGYALEHPEDVRRDRADDLLEVHADRRAHAISGRAYVNSEDPILNEPLALPMLIDIFSERGYHIAVDKQLHEIPERVDLKTGAIIRRAKTVYRITSSSRRPRSAAARLISLAGAFSPDQWYNHRHDPRLASSRSPRP